jgi:hypothetical protein
MAYDNCFSRKLLREENRESRLAEKIRESCGHRQDELKFQQRKKKTGKELTWRAFLSPNAKKNSHYSLENANRARIYNVARNSALLLQVLIRKQQ